ncbi:Rv3235 family protein [Promicromonospora sp. NPDC057488]|uniref:Rv3235 family protein n=1 Tax=Promicromonospora sp. NPDC057488 TaxID=3346147 RepID=UPI00366F190A
MTTLDTSPGGGARSRPGAPSMPAAAAAAPAVVPAPAQTRAPTAAPAQDAARTRLPARRTAVPPSGPVTGPGIGRRLRRMRIGGTPYPELQNAAAALEALSGRPAPEPDPDLPDPTAQVCRVVRAAVEVLRGERPASQLARWVTPQVYDQLLERGRLMREARQVRPPRPKAHPAAVRRVRMVRLGATSAEATVILHDEGRVRAAAVRLEARRGVWRVAVLEIG